MRTTTRNRKYCSQTMKTNVRIQNPIGNVCERIGTMLAIVKWRDNFIKLHCGKVLWRNRKFLRATTKEMRWKRRAKYETKGRLVILCNHLITMYLFKALYHIIEEKYLLTMQLKLRRNGILDAVSAPTYIRKLLSLWKDAE